jgi:hypothetical protein
LKALLVSGLLLPCLVSASDHNNIDKERPLRFDDAYSIALGAFEFQNGARVGRGRFADFRSELQWGFAKNQDLSIGVESGTRQSLFQVVELSYFNGFQREIEDQPAFGMRFDLERNAQRPGIDGRLRLIGTKTLRQYDKLHLNLDLESRQGVRTLGAILGYSVPLGYPTHFDQTLLAEVGAGYGGSWFGIGIRRQLSATGVLDFGIQTPVPRGGAAVTLGYSFSF